MFEVERCIDRRNGPAIRNYLTTISRYPLLEKHQEAELASLMRQVPKMVQTQNTLEQAKMSSVSLDAVAEELELSPRKMAQIKAACAPGLGLDRPVNETGGTLAETLAEYLGPD